jgi:hypothetical protein
MKKKKWAVDPTKKVCWIVEFIKKYIKCEPPDSLVSSCPILPRKKSSGEKFQV